MPELGIYEDPVTGSVQCFAAHYWGTILNKNSFRIKQLSSRGGEMKVEIFQNKTEIQGRVIPVFRLIPSFPFVPETEV